MPLTRRLPDPVESREHRPGREAGGGGSILRVPVPSLPSPAARLEGMATTVLIVDDSPTFRSAARLLLESEGYEVLGEAGDGETAVARARDLRPELVLLDVKLPDTDGFDVAGRLTRWGDGPGVILVSSHDARDFGSLVEQSGARGFVAKSDLSGPAIAALLRQR